MRKLFRISHFIFAFLIIASAVKAQDVSINIISQENSVNDGVWALNAPPGTTAILVTICNEDAITFANVPVYKLRPLISVPGAIVQLAPNANQTGLPAGWSIISNTGNSIRISNGTDAIPALECRDIVLYVTPTTVGGPSTVTATIAFANGAAPGNVTGPQTPGNDPANDNSTTAIIVTAPVTPPTATADVATTPAGTPVTFTVTTNDTPGSAAIDPATVKLIDPSTGVPAVGNTVTIPGSGTFTVDPTTGAVTFTPVTGFVGPVPPVNYTVNDVNGLTSNPAPITVTVTGTPPVATGDPVTTPVNTPVTFTVTTNDTPGSAAIDPATVKLIDPSTGVPAVGNTVTIPGSGTFTVDPTTGAVTFTPVTGFVGPVPPVNYTVNDVNGLTSNPAPITVTVTGTPPVATGDPVTTPVNTPVTFTVTTNDTPGSAAIDPATVKLIDPSTGVPAVGNTVTIPGSGTFTVDPTTGAVTFTPVTGFVGPVPPVNYTVNDVNGLTSNPAPITVTVTGTPPVATNDMVSTSVPITITVLTNDTPGSAPIDPTKVMLIDPISNTPTTSVTIPGEGTYTVNTTTGEVTFVPDPLVTTPITSTVQYTITDTNNMTSVPATISINVTALPVTLISFTAKKEASVAVLNWATTEETNSDHFEIQHSLSGKDWNKIGTVKSHGDSKVRNTYTFSDINPANGENLYRLKMIDRDATFAYSRIRNVKFEGLNSAAVSVYPNPSSDKVMIQDMDLAQVKQVSILDMNGHALFSTSKVSADGINVSKFNSGTYILHITNINGSISNHKIVIAK